MAAFPIERAQVLKPREVAAVLGVDQATVRNWVKRGSCPNAFAGLDGTRIGIPWWWVEERINAGRPDAA